MIVKKILVGANAGLYLPFGMSRLRALQQANGTEGYFTQQYDLGAATVKVTQAPPYSYVRVISQGGDAYFEFQTSGFPVSIVSGKYQAATVAVTVNKGTLSATLLDGQRVANTGVTAPLHRSQQVQLLDEPNHYRDEITPKKYDRVVYQSWAPHNPHTGIHLRSYHCEMVPYYNNTNRSAAVPHLSRDVSYDVGFADSYTFNKQPVRYAYLRDPADWPRSIGLQQVVNGSDVNDVREYAIYVDAFDQVSVFPTIQITDFLGNDGGGDPIQNVDPTYVMMQRVDFPAWVYNKSQTFASWYAANPGNTGLTDFPEYQWQAHPDGTKMCAVVYRREAVEFDSTFYGDTALTQAWDGTSGFQGFLPDATSWDLLNTQIIGMYPQLGVTAEGAGSTRYMSATGLLSVDINITITGPNPEDFSLSLTTNELREPETSVYCTLLAGYAWHDIDPIPSNDFAGYGGASRGDMLVLDACCYGRTYDAAVTSMMVLKNLSTANDMRTFGAENEDRFVDPGSLSATGISKVLAFDIPTASFAIKHTHKETTPDPSTCITHFGIGIYVMNKFQTTLYPETIDPTAKAIIDACIAADGLQVMAQGVVLDESALMPVNDLRTWGDTDMDSLREDYDSAQTAGGPTAFSSVTPDLIGNQYMLNFGLKYARASRVTAPATQDAVNWFYNCLPQGRRGAYPIFQITDPRPGWYQYMGELMSRIQVSPYTTFFAHPNGSWAFFNQEFLYNKAGSGAQVGSIALANDSLTCAVPLDVANFEHCIFDAVHIVCDPKDSKVDSSFVKLYNLAVTTGISKATILDDSAIVALSDMRATFSTDTVADQVDGTIVYDSFKINWQGYTARLTDHQYFSGVKQMFDPGDIGFLIPNWEYFDGDLLQCASLGSYWTDLGVTSYVVPQVEANPVTFSSCVLVTN